MNSGDTFLNVSLFCVSHRGQERSQRVGAKLMKYKDLPFNVHGVNHVAQLQQFVLAIYEPNIILNQLPIMYISSTLNIT